MKSLKGGKSVNIKPIETEYNGYRFRSRLEARWAVFFDAAGIKYEYESEGFVCDDGTKYLPDFYLPKYNTYVEVKGERDGAWEEIKKAQKMITWGGNIRRILILGNIPNNDAYDGGMWHFPCFYWDGHIDCVYVGWWYFCDYFENGEPVHGHMSHADYLPPWAIRENGEYWVPRNEKLSFQCVSDAILKKQRFGERKWQNDLDYEFNHSVNSKTFDAFNKAQQARFEHGENPVSGGK